MSVDLPAPLSPTSAITSPSRTSKFTRSSACTAPKLFETSRSSRVGRGVAFTGVFYNGGGAPEGAPHRVDRLLAVLGVLAVADLAPLQEAFLEEQLVVRLRDPDRGEQDRLRSADLAVHARDLLAVANEDLVEDPPSLDRIPVRPLVAGFRLLERPSLVQRVQDRVVAALEELRVVVLDVAVQLADDRMAGVLPLRPDRGNEPPALELAD